MYHSRKYKINEKFFDNWSPQMAYVLGFWFADGYMRKEKSYRISFYSNDKGILQQIRTVLQASHPLRKNKDDNTWVLLVFSKHMYEKLKELGGLRKKSRVVRFPYVPKQYVRDFIRGYFDEDGSVFRVKYLRTKDHKLARELRSNFTSGSRVFLEQLMTILYDMLDLKKKVLGIYNDGSSLKLGYGSKDTRKLLDFLYYSDNPISLKRKERFLQNMES